MSDPTGSATIPYEALVRLSPGVRLQKDKISGQTMLLYPESTLQLNATGTAIAELCDGRSFEQIVNTLAQRFNALPDVLRADVTRYLLRLRERRLVEWSPHE